MKEANFFEEIITTPNQAKDAINTELKEAAKRIQSIVNNLIPLYPNLFTSPVQLERAGGEQGSKGGYFEEYAQYESKTGEITWVSEEYFAFGLSPPIIHGVKPLPVTV